MYSPPSSSYASDRLPAQRAPEACAGMSWESPKSHTHALECLARKRPSRRGGILGVLWDSSILQALRLICGTKALAVGTLRYSAVPTVAACTERQRYVCGSDEHFGLVNRIRLACLPQKLQPLHDTHTRTRTHSHARTHAHAHTHAHTHLPPDAHGYGAVAQTNGGRTILSTFQISDLPSYLFPTVG